jgi:hypothetical protein
MSKLADRPIFIVGSARSGTTIFYRLLAGHKSLGWISSYVRRWPARPWLALLNFLHQTSPLVKAYRDKRWMPIPDEAYDFWDRFHPVENSLGGPPLNEKDVVLADTEGLHRFIVDILRYSRRTRFLNKNIRNSRRIRYLDIVFPDALFIHIIRDGRAVTHSLLNIYWWPTLSLWWAEGKTVTELQREGLDPAVIAARMWKSEVQGVLVDKEWISQQRYIEIRYEKLMHDPITEMKRIIDFCDLPWTSQFQKSVKAFELENRNYKWANAFTPQQIAAIEKELGPSLKQLEYV